jgi:ankyrin repeat protein
LHNRFQANLGMSSKVMSMKRIATMAAVMAVFGGALVGGCRHADMYEAAARNRTTAISELLKRGVRPDATNEPDRRTPLHVAAFKGNAAAVRLLLDAGANMQAKDDRGLTPLMLAAKANHAEVVQILLSKHPVIDTQDAFGATALMWACVQKNRTVAAMLVRAGARTDVKDVLGRTPQYYADMYHFGDVLRDPR